jgi:hypothetical protein
MKPMQTELSWTDCSQAESIDRSKTNAAMDKTEPADLMCVVFLLMRRLIAQMKLLFGRRGPTKQTLAAGSWSRKVERLTSAVGAS